MDCKTVNGIWTTVTVNGILDCSIAITVNGMLEKLFKTEILPNTNTFSPRKSGIQPMDETCPKESCKTNTHHAV